MTKRIKQKKDKFKIGTIGSDLILTNAHAIIVHDACKVCWDKPTESEYSKKIEYITKRVKTGHESVMEHSNVVILIHLTMNNIEDILECMPLFHYLNIKYKPQKNGDLCILIGGSVRAYKHIFKNIENQNNTVALLIKQELYQCTYAGYYIDLIEAGVMDIFSFINPVEEEVLTLEEKAELTEFEKDGLELSNPQPNRIETGNDKFDIINLDKINECFDKVSKYGFNYDDLLDMCTVTILFKDMSRIITQQLERHRNGITQESQRYVDYSGAMFNSPAEFKPKYDKTKLYDITLNHRSGCQTLQELGEDITGIYKQLREQGLDKEDARAYLPCNIQSAKVYITFTYRNLIHFLNLRVDPAAQAEIRDKYAIHIEKIFAEEVAPYIGELYKYLLPKYVLTETDGDYSLIDEVLEDVIESR